MYKNEKIYLHIAVFFDIIFTISLDYFAMMRKRKNSFMDAAFRSKLNSTLKPYIGLSGDRAAASGCMAKAVDEFTWGEIDKDAVLELVREEIRYYVDPSALTTREAEKKECFDEVLQLLNETLGW